MDVSTTFYFLWNLHIILESLPISSSGHIELINNWIALRAKREPIAISSRTSYLMHIPTLIVVGIFLAMHNAWTVATEGETTVEWLISNMALVAIPMLIANTITFGCYLLLKLTKKPVWPLYVGFFITAGSLFSLFHAPQGAEAFLSYVGAAVIGIAQGFALLPGVSRLALTFVTGVWLGLIPASSFYFSLIIEFFLILGAVIKALSESSQLKEEYLSHLNWRSLVSLAFSSAIAYATLELVFYTAQNNTFAYFGFYLLVLAIYLFLFCSQNNEC